MIEKIVALILAYLTFLPTGISSTAIDAETQAIVSKPPVIAQTEPTESVSTGNTVITPAELESIRNEDDVLILDVRTYAQFHSARINPALSMPARQIALRVREIPAGTALIVVGDDDDQEAEAVTELVAAGIEEGRIRTLAGGIDGWLAAGFELTEVTDEIPPC